MVSRGRQRIDSFLIVAAFVASPEPENMRQTCDGACESRDFPRFIVVDELLRLSANGETGVLTCDERR
jgi:hypothetical protein